MEDGEFLRLQIRGSGLTVEQAAVRVELARKTLYNYFKEETFDNDQKNLFATKLNIDFTQNVKEGSDSDNELNEDFTQNDSVVKEKESPYLIKRRNKKNELKEFRVPLVTVKARAGYVKTYDSTDIINSLEKYAIPPGVTYTGAIWRYFEVDGDSMEPALVTGDYVLCSQVPQDDWENIRNFYVHVLVTDSEVLIKRIFVKDTGEWVLISDNETHKQRFFDVTTLKELWVFRRLIKKTISAKKVFKINI